MLCECKKNEQNTLVGKNMENHQKPRVLAIESAGNLCEFW